MQTENAVQDIELRMFPLTPPGTVLSATILHHIVSVQNPMYHQHSVRGEL